MWGNHGMMGQISGKMSGFSGGRYGFMMDRKAVKAEAKGILGRARMSPYVTTLLVLGTGFLLSRLTDWVQGGSPRYSDELQAR